MDIDKAKKAFLSYVSKYDEQDEQIRLKVIHTLQVCENSIGIARAMGLSKEDQQIAYLIGLLHDIGRFEQIRKYHTFMDAKSVNHAELGIHVLKANHLIREFYEDERLDELIYTAIFYHNQFEIVQDLEERTQLHTKILRDSDKIDIFRVDCYERCELLFLCSPSQLQEDYISKAVFEDVMQGHCILASKRCTNLDILITHIAFIFDMNFKESIRILHQQGYYDTLLHMYKFHDLTVQKAYDDITQLVRQHMESMK